MKGTDFVICDKDIEYLSGRLNNNAILVFKCFQTNKPELEQVAIIESSGLTRASTREELIRLEGAGFISSAPGSHRRTIYWLTPTGKRLSEVIKSQEKEGFLTKENRL